MSDDRLDEILRRLEALEQRLPAATDDAGPNAEASSGPEEPIPDDPNPHEKRFVDLVVRLVVENVEQTLRSNLLPAIERSAIDERRLAAQIANTVTRQLRGEPESDRGDHGPRDRGRNGGGDRGPRDRDRNGGDRGPRDRDRNGGDRGPRDRDRDRGRDGWHGRDRGDRDRGWDGPRDRDRGPRDRDRDRGRRD